ncbi:MAG: strawberry notch C-terminal domain-containing protein, partial [Methyloceanibacter sp.]
RNLEYKVDVDGPYFVRHGRGSNTGARERPFYAEQIDAVALAIDNAQQGGALILGDMTGQGKGRVNAAIIRYAMLHNLVPVFVTEKADLYGDMYRDLTDIGFKEHFGREPNMFMTNTGESVPLDDEALEWIKERDAAKDAGEPLPKKRGVFLKQGGSAAVNQGMQEVEEGSGKWDMVFTTYSQMQTVAGQETPRRPFLRRIAPRSFFVLDETHNAGGQGQEGWVAANAPPGRAEFVRELLLGRADQDGNIDMASRAAAVMYSSATYAKRPQVMDLYARTDMAMAVDDPANLPDLIQNGGVPLQQIVAGMLAKAGQMIRRESSYEGITFTPELVEVDGTVYGDVAGAIQAIYRFDDALSESGEKDDLIQAALDEAGADIVRDMATGQAGANMTEFASVMHNVITQMILAIKADAVADLAIKAHQNGEKPVIGLFNTMESFVSDYAKSEKIKIGDPIDINFSDVLHRYLKRTLRVTITTADGKKHYIFAPVDRLSPELQRIYREAMDAIDSGGVYAGLPVSPIDWMRAKMEKAGMRVAEITGRKGIINYSGDTPIYGERKKSELGIAGKRTTIASFNGGGLDAIIYNSSGSTGVSFHASIMFKDQKPRRYIGAQSNPNIDTQMQMYGRINRLGQVVDPAYSEAVADIPAEVRPMAVLMRKMASLNANTTAARQGVFTAEAVDFMNQYGDRVVAQLMEEDPELNRRMGEPVKHDTNHRLITENAAARVTGRLMLLYPEEQRELIDRIQDQYKAMIAALDAMGENALEAKTLDLAARSIGATQIKERTGQSPFQDGVWIEKVSVKAQGRALSLKEIADEVEAKVGHAEHFPGNQIDRITRLADRGHKWAQNQVAVFIPQAETYQKQIRPKDPEAQKRHDRKSQLDRDRFRDTLRMVYPGSRLSFGDVTGIVLTVERGTQTKSPIAGSSWTATIAVPDGTRQIMLPFSQIFPPDEIKGPEEPGFSVESSRDGFDSLDAKFETARKEGREERFMVTGNILAGYDQVAARGRIIHYTTEDGDVRPGIFTARGFTVQDFLKKRAIRFKAVDQVVKFLNAVPAGTLVTSTDGLIDAGRQHGDWVIEVAAARKTGGRYYTHEDVRKAVGSKDFVKLKNALGEGNRQVMHTELTEERFVATLNAMRGAGAKFSTHQEQQKALAIVNADQADQPPAVGDREDGGALASIGRLADDAKAPEPLEAHSADLLASLARTKSPPGRARNAPPTNEARPSSRALPHPRLRLKGKDAGAIVTMVQEAVDIVTRIAGDKIVVEFHDTIPREMALGPDAAAALKRLEEDGATFEKTARGFWNPKRSIDGDAIIGLALDQSGRNLLTTAGHEASHHVFERLLNDQERALLKTELPRIRAYAASELSNEMKRTVTAEDLQNYPEAEILAIAFQRWRREREEGGTALAGAGKLHIGIRRFFERIYIMLRNIRNGLKGLGYSSYEDIFERTRKGEYRDRPYRGKRGDGLASVGQFEVNPDAPLGQQARDYVLDRGLQTGVEHLVAIDAAGNIVAQRRGSRNRTGTTPELERRLDDPVQEIVVHHNHPDSDGLS